MSSYLPGIDRYQRFSRTTSHKNHRARPTFSSNETKFIKPYWIRSIHRYQPFSRTHSQRQTQRVQTHRPPKISTKLLEPHIYSQRSRDHRLCTGTSSTINPFVHTSNPSQRIEWYASSRHIKHHQPSSSSIALPRGTIVNRTYGTDKKPTRVYIYPFLPTTFGPNLLRPLPQK